MLKLGMLKLAVSLETLGRGAKASLRGRVHKVKVLSAETLRGVRDMLGVPERITDRQVSKVMGPLWAGRTTDYGVKGLAGTPVGHVVRMPGGLSSKILAGKKGDALSRRTANTLLTAHEGAEARGTRFVERLAKIQRRGQDTGPVWQDLQAAGLVRKSHMPGVLQREERMLSRLRGADKEVVRDYREMRHGETSDPGFAIPANLGMPVHSMSGHELRKAIRDITRRHLGKPVRY